MPDGSLGSAPIKAQFTCSAKFCININIPHTAAIVYTLLAYSYKQDNICSAYMYCLYNKSAKYFIQVHIHSVRPINHFGTIFFQVDINGGSRADKSSVGGRTKDGSRSFVKQSPGSRARARAAIHGRLPSVVRQWQPVRGSRVRGSKSGSH